VRTRRGRGENLRRILSGGRTAAAVFASYAPRRRFVAALVGAAAAFAIGAPVAGAAPWTGSGTASDGTGRTPTITVLSDGTDSPAKFHYDFVEPDPLDPGCCATGNFEFKTTASAPGTITLDWNYRGHHAFFQVQAGLTAFVNSGGSDVQTVTLVSAGPTDCCTEPSGGFSYSGRVVLNITAPGDTYGFRMTGSNSDLNASLEGTLSLALVVDKTDDSSGGACDSSVPNDCSLRSAIEKANSAVGADGINFNIPGAGVHTITPDTALPELTGQVTIDGYTQPGASANTLATGNNAVLQIELNGNDGLFDGLAVSAGGSTIQGLVINNFRGDAIELRNEGENRITGNFIGTNAAGTALLTSGSGIFVNASPGNWIGGQTPSERNVIAAAVNHAIRTPGPPLGAGEPAGGNVIQGNYVGTDKAGTAAIGVGGISLSNPNNVVGGTAAGAGNVLSTVGVGGVFLSEADAHHNTIQGNHIGVNAAGTAMLGSGVVAITLQRASENLIGGTTAAARNVIASASGGISIFGVSGPSTPANNVVQGNYIGTDATGTVGMPVSAGSAVLIDSSVGNTIGGTRSRKRPVPIPEGCPHPDAGSCGRRQHRSGELHRHKRDRYGGPRQLDRRRGRVLHRWRAEPEHGQRHRRHLRVGSQRHLR
jgi:CSLREA domain-containing protein